jgi:GNAT superfamily N-acetyltransferase
MSWNSLIGSRAVSCGTSQVEADRFGRSIGRIEVPVGAPPEGASALIREEMARPTPDLLFLRYPAQYVAWFAEFHGHGRDLLFADTLVYWRLGLDGPRVRPSPPRSGLTIVPDSRISKADLAALVSDVFDGYANHYRANPLLDPASALVGYQDWACRSAEKDSIVTLADTNQGIVGLATMMVEDGNMAEILLAGIRTDVQGTGLYSHLMAGCAELARTRGCRQLVISTQGHNAGVQRTWSRLGMLPVATFATVHAVRPGLLRGRA